MVSISTIIDFFPVKQLDLYLTKKANSKSRSQTVLFDTGEDMFITDAAPMKYWHRIKR